MRCLWKLLFSAATAVAVIGANIALAEDSPRFLVVRRTEAELNAAAANGYRIVTRTSGTLMEKVATPPEIYRYRVIKADVKWHKGKLVEEVNAAGAQGYRLLPSSVVFVPSGITKQLLSIDAMSGTDEFILEKEPHPHNYEYKLVSDKSSWSGSSSGQLDLKDGFDLVGMEISSNANAYLIYERDMDAAPPDGRVEVTRLIR